MMDPSIAGLMAASHQPTTEITPLSPAEEVQFQQWTNENSLYNVDHPDAHYDMRGYWKDIASKGRRETEINAQDGLLHFPDTYKQHGHPSFSQESKYSTGPADGGMWVGGDTYLAQPKMGVNHVLAGLQQAVKR